MEITNLSLGPGEGGLGSKRELRLERKNYNKELEGTPGTVWRNTTISCTPVINKPAQEQIFAQGKNKKYKGKKRGDRKFKEKC